MAGTHNKNSIRRPPSAVTRRRLERTFGGKRCVMTGAVRGVEWHHLDEDRSNAAYENFLPLCRDVNTTLEFYRQRCVGEPWTRGVDSLVTPAVASAHAGDWYRHGEAGSAYGAARLASRLVLQYRQLFEDEWPGIAYVWKALRVARHLDDDDLYVDILRRDLSPVLDATHLCAIDRMRLLLECASAYEDRLEIRAAQHVRDRVGRVQPNEQSADDQVRELRRRGIALTISDERYQDARRMLAEADAIASRMDCNAWVTTHVSRAWLEIRAGRPTAALDFLTEANDVILQPSGAPDPRLAAPWIALEATLTERRALTTFRSPGVARLRHVAERLDFQRETGATSKVTLRPVAIALSAGDWSDELRAAEERLRRHAQSGARLLAELNSTVDRLTDAA